MKVLAKWDKSDYGNDCYINELWTIQELFTGIFKLIHIIVVDGYNPSDDSSSYILEGSESDMQVQVNEIIGEKVEDLQIWDIEESNEMSNEELIRIGKSLVNFMEKGCIYNLCTHDYYGNIVNDVADIEQITNSY